MRADEFLPMNDKTRQKLNQFEKGNQVSLDFMIIFMDRLFNFIVEIAMQDNIKIDDDKNARASFVNYMIIKIYERKVQKHYFPAQYQEEEEKDRHRF